jgi:hypothetical protein
MSLTYVLFGVAVLMVVGGLFWVALRGPKIWAAESLWLTGVVLFLAAVLIVSFVSGVWIGRVQFGVWHLPPYALLGAAVVLVVLLSIRRVSSPRDSERNTPAS